ncbi:hypothetical protein Q6247_25400, partial [Klebsiella pneumoniae]
MRGLPLRKADYVFYLDWAVHSIRIANCSFHNTSHAIFELCCGAL